MLTTIMIIGIVILGLLVCALSYSAGWNAGAKQILAEYDGLPSYQLKVDGDALPRDISQDGPEGNGVVVHPRWRETTAGQR